MRAHVHHEEAACVGVDHGDACACGCGGHGSPPIVIGHRGGSGYHPEHTLASYKLAMDLGAAGACVAIVLWSVIPLSIEPSAPDHALQELVAGHVRSLMVDHLTDVTSSDSHTVKPWFERKLDFSPPPPDLTMQGFLLVGGRLEYFGKRSVAALVYQRWEHVINLFICPAQPEIGGNATMVTRQGYHLAHWQVSGLSYWAVSNLNQAELQEFVQAVRQQTAALPS